MDEGEDPVDRQLGVVTLDSPANRNALSGALLDQLSRCLEAAFADGGASQCGYCSPGVIMTACALLEKNPDPTPQQIREATAGNLCRCTGYNQITEAIEDAAQRLREEKR